MSADSDFEKGSMSIEPTQNATTSAATPTGRASPVSENRPDSPHSQRNVNSPEATLDLLELYTAIEQRKNFFKQQKPGIQKDRTRAILKQLYRLNQRHARMVLYNDYINLALESGPDFVNLAPESCSNLVNRAPKSGSNFAATGKYRPLGKGWEDLEEHLHRYCKWKTVAAIVTWLYRPQSLQYHIENRSNFRTARATKEYQEFMTTHKDRSKTSKTSNRLIEVAARISVVDDYKQQQLKKPSQDLSAKIDEAERSLWKYFQDQITGKLAHEDELREKQEEEAKKEELQRKEEEEAAMLKEKEAETEARKKEEEDKEEEKERRRFWSNLKIALFGGSALVAPMLIMTLHQTKLTTLLTTSSFVLAVAVILAATMRDAEQKDIVAATAGYAAVLVVFVGTGAGSKVVASPKPASNGHHSELSGGAIAGIVIGVLTAAFLVILASVYCCCNSLTAILGLRRSRRSRSLSRGHDSDSDSTGYGSAYSSAASSRSASPRGTDRSERRSVTENSDRGSRRGSGGTNIDRRVDGSQRRSLTKVSDRGNRRWFGGINLGRHADRLQRRSVTEVSDRGNRRWFGGTNLDRHTTTASTPGVIEV